MRTEYEALHSEPETNVSLAATLNRSSDGAGSSSGPSSHTSNASSGGGHHPVKVEFSRLSRRLLKRSMPKKHLQKHEMDGLLKCHTFKRQNYRRTYHPEIVSRNMMYELLYLALNQLGDSIQLGDMLRFIKEGHLTFTDVLKFLPADLTAAQRMRLQHEFRGSASACPSGSFIRYGAKQLSNLIGVHVRLPDLAALSARYVAELALPPAVQTIVETLLTICPPLMVSPRGSTKTPPYEARAVAFVLFVMKLLFGLDDEREARISANAQRINARLRTMSTGGGGGGDGDAASARQQPLFVWTEWQQYVEMRGVILAQCHYATAAAQSQTPTADTAHLYAGFLRSNLTDVDWSDLPALKRTEYRKEDREAMLNMGMIFGKAAQLHARHANETTTRASLNFLPTLQPRSAYLERLLEDDVMAATIHIPAFMYTDHTARDLVPFLRPGELRRRLPPGQRLRVQRLSGVHRFRVEPPFMPTWPEARLPYTAHWTLRSYRTNVGVDEWTEQMRNSDAQTQRNDVAHCEELMDAVAEHLEIMKASLRVERDKVRAARAAERCTNSSPVANGTDDDVDANESLELFSQPMAPTDSDDADIPAAQLTTETLQPRQIVETVPLFEMILSEDEADADDENAENEPLHLCLNSFDYWLRAGRVDEMRYGVFAELCALTLPQNFVWLLRQCAQLIECSERDVYRELMIVENFFAYRLAPVERMRNVTFYQPEKRRRMHIPDVLMRSRQTNPLY